MSGQAVVENAPVKQIDTLIVNSPYEEPRRYWKYRRDTRDFVLVEGERRSAGYHIATPGSKEYDDPGLFKELPTVNIIRPRVQAWREAGYPGVTGTTLRLLAHWNDRSQRPANRQLFFCQLEAIETLIWLTEAAPSDVQGIVVEGDGGPFTRYCSKMGTGTGKTIVMAMVIAWQVLNKAAKERDSHRFSQNVLIVAPGLTVKNRLKVLEPTAEGNYYDDFDLIPSGMRERLHQGRVLIHNWHHLDWDSEERLAKRKSVDKRGPKSDRAYAHDVLGDMAKASRILVLNDEAHHAWRVPAGEKIAGVSKSEKEQATKWVGGLDRLNRAVGLLTCYDFSATPFVPTGKQSSDERLFSWIVSDFGLNDAIEAGLVKTPRVVVRDDGLPDAKTYKSKLYHIYNDPDVKDDLNRKAEPQERLPQLVTDAYHLLGRDWLAAREAWEKSGQKTPPVMITVANRTETAARIKWMFDHGQIRIDELKDPEKTLHIDSKVLDVAEAQDEPIAITPAADDDSDGEETESDADVADSGDDEESDTEGEASPAKKLTKKQMAEQLRQKVDTVGQPGKPGAPIQNVVSVGMLSEGWDARTVTHIMGLRAFTSQLLCEQVVGRGLRRTNYEAETHPDGRVLFRAEHVNIFGVPFTFLPHEGGDGPPPPPPAAGDWVEPLTDRARDFEIRWPNILKIEPQYRTRLSLDLARLSVLELRASQCITRADMAFVVDGKPDLTRWTQIQLQDIADRFRFQTMIFEAARDTYAEMQPSWKGPKDQLLVQVIRLAEQFLRSDRITIDPPLFHQDELRRRVMLTLSMSRIVAHLWKGITDANAERLVPVFDNERPIRSTGDMRRWNTRRPNELTRRSHINRCVFDSTWEASDASRLDDSPLVDGWARNDHLGFEVWYVFRGGRRRYYPDFLVRLKNRRMLVLETKGVLDDEARAKRQYLGEWIRAVNDHGGFGEWVEDMAYKPEDIVTILERHGRG